MDACLIQSLAQQYGAFVPAKTDLGLACRGVGVMW